MTKLAHFICKQQFAANVKQPSFLKTNEKANKTSDKTDSFFMSTTFFLLIWSSLAFWKNNEKVSSQKVTKLVRFICQRNEKAMSTMCT